MSATLTHQGKRNCTVTKAEYLQQQRNDATTVGNSWEQRNSEAQQSREKKATAKHKSTTKSIDPSPSNGK